MNRTHRSKFIWAAAGLAVFWRLASPWMQQRAVDAEVISQSDHTMFVTLGIMGLGFVACGVLAFRWAGTQAAWIFALHAAFSGLHWGGPLGTSREAWVVYLFLSAFIGAALLLHFMLLFPRPLAAASRRSTWFLLYTPLAASALVVLAVVALPGGDNGNGGLMPAFWVLHLLVPNFYSLLGIAIVVARFARATPDERRTDGLSFLLLGMVLGVLPYLGVLAADAAGVVLPGGSQPYNLFFLLMPMGCCAAILRQRLAERGRRGTIYISCGYW